MVTYQILNIYKAPQHGKAESREERHRAAGHGLAALVDDEAVDTAFGVHAIRQLSVLVLLDDLPI